MGLDTRPSQETGVCRDTFVTGGSGGGVSSDGLRDVRGVHARRGLQAPSRGCHRGRFDRCGFRVGVRAATSFGVGRPARKASGGDEPATGLTWTM